LDEMRWDEMKRADWIFLSFFLSFFGSKANWSVDPSSQISSSDPNQALSLLLLIHGSKLRDKKRSLDEMRWRELIGSQISSSDPQPSSLSSSNAWIQASWWEEKLGSDQTKRANWIQREAWVRSDEIWESLDPEQSWSLDLSSQISSSDPQPSSLSSCDPWIRISEEERAWDGSHP
jgi:hypothetical protein